MLPAVYIVRPGPNDELRYSLRSLEAFCPTERVVIVGEPPEWVRGVEVVQIRPHGTKGESTTRSIATALDVMAGEDFYLWHDDFYATAPVPEPGHYDKGRLRDVVATHPYQRGRHFTGALLTLAYLEGMGYEDPLSYEVHTPLLVKAPPMREALARTIRWRAVHESDLHKRTVYAHLLGAPSTTIRDVKYHTLARAWPDAHVPWLSSSDVSFAPDVLPKLRSLLPSASAYERPRKVARVD